MALAVLLGWLVVAPSVARAEPPDAAALSASPDVGVPRATAPTGTPAGGDAGAAAIPAVTTGAALDAGAVAPRSSSAADAAAAHPDATERDAGTSIGLPGVHTTGPQAARPLPSAGRVARVVIGLFVLLALAIVAGQPAVRRFERRAGLAMFVATGMPFLAIGVVAHLPSVGILSDEILRDLSPFLEFGLGWIGFRVGVEFDVREFDRMPRGIARMLAMESGAAFIAAGLGSVAALGMLGGQMYRADFVRDGLVLGACAAVSAPTGARALEAAGILDRDSSRLIRRIAVLDDAVPLGVLALVTAVFRPVDAGRWHLPPLGWVFLQVGMGAALGALTLAVVRAAKNANEEVAFTLGSIAFASGMAGYLGFSPMVVGCVAGVVVTNVSSGHGVGAFGQQLRELERPIYLVFFAIAGAMWDVRDWRGWAVVPLYVLARLLGKLGGARAAFRAEKAAIESAHHAAHHAPAAPHDASMPPPPPTLPVSSWRPLSTLPDGRTIGIALIPTSAVSIAVIVSARQSYPDSIAPFLETVVIVGAIVAELVFQFSVPVVRRGALVPPETMTGPLPAMSEQDAEDAIDVEFDVESAPTVARPMPPTPITPHLEHGLADVVGRFPAPPPVPREGHGGEGEGGGGKSSP